MRILIICPNELFYEPRLRKNAIYFANKRHEVHVLCALTIKKDFETYNQVKKDNPSIVFHEIDISKKNLKSKIIWVFSSVLKLILGVFYKYTGVDLIKSKGILNKTLVLSKAPKCEFDLIYTNLIDTLPFAFYIKCKTSPNAKVVFDSQEFFTGQFSNEASYKRKWVEETEKKFIGNCDFVLGTTTAMVEALRKKYNLQKGTFRVRNVPLRSEIPNITESDTTTPLKLVWHGKSINVNNKRGVHILIKAVLNAKCKCELYLQGKINNEELRKIDLIKNEYSSDNKIHVIPSANPKYIVTSLTRYHIGLIGELPEELNQEYTSSNKLFDFIGAGLAIIAPDVIGLTETINEYKNGLIYPPGDFMKLAEKIEKLSKDRTLLKQLKENSNTAKVRSCFWENDILPFYTKLTTGS